MAFQRRNSIFHLSARDELVRVSEPGTRSWRSNVAWSHPISLSLSLRFTLVRFRVDRNILGWNPWLGQTCQVGVLKNCPALLGRVEAGERCGSFDSQVTPSLRTRFLFQMVVHGVSLVWNASIKSQDSRQDSINLALSQMSTSLMDWCPAWKRSILGLLLKKLRNGIKIRVDSGHTSAPVSWRRRRDWPRPLLPMM